MKKLLFLLLLPFALLAQNPTTFPYGIKFTGSGQPTVTNSPYFTTTAADGRQTKADYVDATVEDTGVRTFAGLTTNSATTINIGAVNGYVVDNETNPAIPVKTKVFYPGATNVTVTTVGSGQASYVMLDKFGAISFQNIFPTSEQRKLKIWLGKVSHPAGSITLVTNEPDYITSPMSFSRDLFQALGPYINDGVYAYANGANLNINITGGNIHGNGINFVNSRQSPNEIAMGPGIAQAFLIRTQTGAGSGATTAITPGSYDVGGTITAIPGSSNQATIQYIWAVPGQGYIVQLGQTLYSSFSAAVQALGRESSFVIYSNLPGNAIPITALVVTKGCTSLADTGVTAQFFRANRTGEFFGATAGTSTATLQSTYNNSLVPQIVTSTALGAMTIKRGSAADTDNILVGQNAAAANSFTVTGEGVATARVLQSNGVISATSANARGNYFTNALTATANNDILTCLDLSPTFTNGAFTGVKNNIIKAAWNTSNFSINDIITSGYTSMHAVSDPTASNYFLAANSSVVWLNTPSAGGNIQFKLGTTTRGQFNATTGNFTLQNGGTFTDAGYRLDVQGTARVTGDITAGSVSMRNVADTFTSSFTNTNTAARTYTLPDISGTISVDANVIHTTGNETFSGTKSSTISVISTPALSITNSLNNSSTAAIVISNTNTGTGLDVSNSTGLGIKSVNTSSAGAALWTSNNNTGNNIYALNSSTGIAVRIDNNSTGKGVDVNNSTGTGVNVTAGTGNGVVSSVTGSGSALVLLNSLAATGKPITYRKNSVEKAYIDDTGNISGQSIIANVTIRQKGYTVSTLPAGTQGDTAYVTDATAPSYLSTVVGGGSVVTPVFYNGTNWVCH